MAINAFEAMTDHPVDHAFAGIDVWAQIMAGDAGRSFGPQDIFRWHPL